MPPHPEPPLRKCTLNLYEADCLALESLLGHGWTTEIRAWVHQHAQGLSGYHKLRKTLGDLE